jgi:hypothetical protein
MPDEVTANHTGNHMLSQGNFGGTFGNLGQIKAGRWAMKLSKTKIARPFHVVIAAPLMRKAAIVSSLS